MSDLEKFEAFFREIGVPREETRFHPCGESFIVTWGGLFAFDKGGRFTSVCDEDENETPRRTEPASTA